MIFVNGFWQPLTAECFGTRRQPRLGAVERLGLRLLVDRQHHGVLRRVYVKPDHGMQLVREGGIV
jgi:hypothetical protein